MDEPLSGWAHHPANNGGWEGSSDPLCQLRSKASSLFVLVDGLDIETNKDPAFLVPFVDSFEDILKRVTKPPSPVSGFPRRFDYRLPPICLADQT